MTTEPHGENRPVDTGEERQSADDLPGMWDHADLSGGWADSEDGRRRPVLHRWVMPYGGWWARWRADIDVEWPDGSSKNLWRRHFRSHARAQKVSAKRFVGMDVFGRDAGAPNGSLGAP